MKYMKNDGLEKELQKELDLPAVPEVIDQKLRQVYAELPEKAPTKRRKSMKTPLKAAIGTASGLAAAFVLLFALNGLSPALAESLPLVGGIFRQINNTEGWINLTETQTSVQQYAQPIEGVAVQVPANGLLEKPMKIAVREVYFDGEFLYAGLSMEINARDSELFNKGPLGREILLNGDSQWKYDEETGMVHSPAGFVLMGHEVWQLTESGDYVSQISFRVPEQYRDLAELDVTLKYNGIYARGFFDTELNTSPFTVNFTAEKNGVSVKRINGGAEMGGVRLVSAAASPAGTVYTLDISSEYVNPSHGGSFEDGCSVGALGVSSPLTMEDGSQRVTLVQGGLRETETRKIVYSVFDKNNTDEYVAVFLLDFQNETVELGSAKDIKSFTSAFYACDGEEIQNFPGRYKISLASHKENGNYLLLFVETKDEHPKTVRMEVWQENTLLGSRVEEQDNRFYEHRGYRNAAGDRVETNTNSYTFGIVGMEILDSAKPVTIKLYDTSTEELMMEEAILLTPEEAHG